MYEKQLLKKNCSFFLVEKWVGNVEYQDTLMWNRFNNRFDIKIFFFSNNAKDYWTITYIYFRVL